MTFYLKLIYNWMGSTIYMHIWRGASFKNKWLRIEAKKNNSNVLKGEIPWRNDKGTIKSTWNISLIYSFSKHGAHCTSQSKKMHFEKILSGNCQAYALFKCDELASRTSKDLNFLSCALPQNLDKQIYFIHIQITFCSLKCKRFLMNSKKKI